jgi:hypothetical protein
MLSTAAVAQLLKPHGGRCSCTGPTDTSPIVLQRAVPCNSRDISYVDYIAVGKGRDMGFETINTFEAKV